MSNDFECPSIRKNEKKGNTKGWEKFGNLNEQQFQAYGRNKKTRNLLFILSKSKKKKKGSFLGNCSIVDYSNTYYRFLVKCFVDLLRKDIEKNQRRFYKTSTFLEGYLRNRGNVLGEMLDRFPFRFMANF